MFVVNKNQFKPIVDKNNSKIYELTSKLPTNGEFSVAYIELPPNESDKKHFHPNMDETYFIIKGDATILIDDKRKRVSSGDLIFIPKKSVHCLINDSNEMVEFVAFSSPAWTPDCEVLV